MSIKTLAPGSTKNSPTFSNHWEHYHSPYTIKHFNHKGSRIDWTVGNPTNHRRCRQKTEGGFIKTALLKPIYYYIMGTYTV